MGVFSNDVNAMGATGAPPPKVDQFGQTVVVPEKKRSMYTQVGQAFDPYAADKDASGVPVMPGFQGVVDTSGNLKEQYRMTPGQLGNATPWMNIMNQQNQMMTNQGVSDAQQMGITGANTQISQLAQGGGINLGGRERAAKAGARNAMFGGQQARAAGAGRAMDIGIKGEELNRAADQFNIGNQMDATKFNTGLAVGDIGALNQYNLGMYDTNVGQYGSAEAHRVQMAANASRPKSIWERMFS